MKLSEHIDHTILRPDCTPDAIKQVCQEAIAHGFAAVCIPPFFVPQATRLLEDHPVKVATVVGFPLGYAPTPAKMEAIKKTLEDGADEVDAVVNLSALKSGNWNYVANDIESMATATRLRGKTIKIILETGLLTEAEITQLCGYCVHSGVDFVKTSTGFNGQGANLEAVNIIRQALNGKTQIKASGGIRTAEEAHRFLEAGASRIGTSAGVALVS